MTDPFADLERELLGAHARDTSRGAARRRLLPGLPRALAVTASVAAVSVGFVWLAGIATEGDPERAAAPPGAVSEDGQCQIRWVKGPAPAVLRSRFAVLRRDGGAGSWDRGVDASADVVYTEGVREVERAGRRFAVIPVKFASRGDCDELTPGVCLYGNGGRSQCVRAGPRAVVASVVVAHEPGRRHVFVLGEDAVRRIRVQTYGGSGVARTVDIEMRSNVTYASIPFGSGQRIRVTPVK